MKKITSSSNEIFKSLKGLTTSKEIWAQKKFLLSGEKIVSEVLQSHPQQIDCILISDSDSPSEIQGLLKNHHALELSKVLFSEIDVLGTHSPILVCHLPEISEYSTVLKNNKWRRLLCPLQDPLNVGALIRSAAAFDINEVVLLKESANPFLPKAVRSAGGQIFNIRLSRGPSIQELTQTVIALDMNGVSLNHFSFPPSFDLLVGEEGKGLPSHIKAQRVSIPMNANVESLNAVVATSIVLQSAYQSK